MGWTVAGLSEQLGIPYEGDGGVQVTRVAPLGRAQRDCLGFLARAEWLELLRATEAGAVILAAEHAGSCPSAALISPNPYADYARAAQLLHPPARFEPRVTAGASVAATAELAADVHVGERAVVEGGAVLDAGVVVEAGACVGRDVRIGAGSRLAQGVVVRADCVLGRRCVVQPGAVIGSDGFGFAPDGDEWVRIPQVGRAVLGDDVHVGANTTIDRGALEDTVVEDGVILDNQIQVAHNVRIGAGTAIAGCVGIAGSAVIGRRCAIGGGAGIVGHLEIVDDVQITAMSLVTKSIDRPGTYSSGVPLESNGQWRRNAARFRQLDRMARRLRAVEAALGRSVSDGATRDEQQ